MAGKKKDLKNNHGKSENFMFSIHFVFHYNDFFNNCLNIRLSVAVAKFYIFVYQSVLCSSYEAQLCV